MRSRFSKENGAPVLVVVVVIALTPSKTKVCDSSAATNAQCGVPPQCDSHDAAAGLHRGAGDAVGSHALLFACSASVRGLQAVGAALALTGPIVPPHTARHGRFAVAHECCRAGGGGGAGSTESAGYAAAVGAAAAGDAAARAAGA